MNEGAWFDRWTGRYDELVDALPIYRVVFGLWILVAIVPRGSWLKDVPDVLRFPPLGTPFLFGATPPDWIIDGTSVLLAGFAGLLISGKFPRTAAWGIALSLLALDTWRYSFGKIDHSILMIAAPAVLGFSGWARSKRRPASVGLALLALTIGLAWITAAAPKIHTGWLSLEYSATRFHVVRNFLVTGREGALTQWALSLDSNFLWLAMDFSTVALESLILLSILNPKLLRFALAAAAVFHLGVYLLMSISAALYVIVYSAFFPWNGLARHASIHHLRAMANQRQSEIAAATIILSCVVGLISVYSINPFVRLQYLFFGAEIISPLVIWLGGLVGLSYMIHHVFRLLVTMLTSAPFKKTIH